MFKQLLSVITITILTTLIATPSFSDDVQINLDPTTPYVDVPVTVSEPVDATVQTVTGTPDNDFIDSWIEVWQGATRLAFNDDGAHSATNYLASIITMPLQVGEYFIRATSYAYMCCNVYPTGNYLLSTNLIVVTPSPTPTPTSSPTDAVESPQPSSPSPSPTDTLGPTSYPEVPEPPVQEPSEPDPVVLEESLEPVPSPTPSVQDTLEEVVDSSFNEQPLNDEISSLPSSLDDEENQVQPSLDEESVSFLGVDITLPPLLSEAVQQVFESITDSLETISNLGSEFTPEEREQAQQVVLGAIIVTQLSSVRRTK